MRNAQQSLAARIIVSCLGIFLGTSSTLLSQIRHKAPQHTKQSKKKQRPLLERRRLPIGRPAQSDHTAKARHISKIKQNKEQLLSKMHDRSLYRRFLQELDILTSPTAHKTTKAIAGNNILRIYGQLKTQGVKQRALRDLQRHKLSVESLRKEKQSGKALSTFGHQARHPAQSKAHAQHLLHLSDKKAAPKHKK